MQGFGTTVFAEMSALAVRTGSVNLGQGFPDTDGPQAMLDRFAEGLRSGLNQYPPGPGVPELRQAVARHQKQYGVELDPDGQVLVTVGATEAIAASVLALAEPGDEVLLVEPYYDSYAASVALAGATRRTVPLRRDHGRFRLDVEELRAAVGPRTRLLLLNTPHNPTGSVLTSDELGAVAELCVERDLLVISDEVYEHLTFGVPHIPISTLPGMRERTLTISSGGKSFSFTGWKVGWATGPADLVAAVMGAKQFLSYMSGAPLQPAIAHALGSDEAYFAGFRAGMRAQRDQLCDGLDALGFEVFVPEGTYFATTDIRPLGFDDGLDFCRRLPELAGVVAIPHQVFYDDVDAGRPLVRWAFCKRPEVIAEALNRLRRLRPGGSA